MWCEFFCRLYIYLTCSIIHWRHMQPCHCTNCSSCWNLRIWNCLTKRVNWWLTIIPLNQFHRIWFVKFNTVPSEHQDETKHYRLDISVCRLHSWILHYYIYYRRALWLETARFYFCPRPPPHLTNQRLLNVSSSQQALLKCFGLGLGSSFGAQGCRECRGDTSQPSN